MRCKFEGKSWPRCSLALLGRSLSLAVVAIFLNVHAAYAQEIGSKPSVEKASVQQVREGQAANSAISERSIPFKRDEGAGIGAGMATGTAACLLLLGVWVALQFRARQGQGGSRGKRLQLPWLQWFGSPAGERSLRVVESASLTAQARLHVVEWRGKEYLISTSADVVRILDSAASTTGGTSAEPAATRRSGRRK